MSALGQKRKIDAGIVMSGWPLKADNDLERSGHEDGGDRLAAIASSDNIAQGSGFGTSGHDAVDLTVARRINVG